MKTETAVESQRILQRFTTSESEFSRHVGVIKEETQRRKTAFFDEIERKESVLSDQLGSLQAETIAEQERIVASLIKTGNEFGPKLSEVEAEAKARIEQQRDRALRITSSRRSQRRSKSGRNSGQRSGPQRFSLAKYSTIHRRTSLAVQRHS